MVALAIEFLLKALIPLLRGQVSILQIGIGDCPDLFDRQFFKRVYFLQVVPGLAKATAEQMRESGHEPVSMHATPTSNFEMIHAKFLLCSAEASFDCPASKCNPE